MKHEYPKVEVDDKSIAEERKKINVKKHLAITDGQRPLVSTTNGKFMGNF